MHGWTLNSAGFPHLDTHGFGLGADRSRGSRLPRHGSIGQKILCFWNTKINYCTFLVLQFVTHTQIPGFFFGHWKTILKFLKVTG